MDYEKKYKEALEKARIAYNKITPENTAVKKLLEESFPELLESEDERTRKFLVKHISEWIGCIEHDLKISTKDVESEEELAMFKAGLAYLEKQKEQKHDAIDAKSERVIKAARRVLNNWLDGTDCPDVSGDFAELEYAIRKYDGEEKQKEQEHICDSAQYEEGFKTGLEIGLRKQKEQKPVEYLDKDKVYAIMKKLVKLAAFSQLIPINSEEYKMIDEITCDIHKLLDYPIEQKPTEKQDYSGLNELERAIHRGFLCAGVENVPVNIIKETAQDCLAHLPAEWSEDFDKEVENIHKRYPEVSFAKLTRIAYHFSKWANRYKDAEWSEEDEKNLENIRIHLFDIGEDAWADTITKLKSLRPVSKESLQSWKPSEEQIYSLGTVVKGYNECTVGSVGYNLKELYRQLKELK